MNLLGGTIPQHGMSRDEADALVRDQAAGLVAEGLDTLKGYVVWQTSQ